jgi:hypothetical protein
VSPVPLEGARCPVIRFESDVDGVGGSVATKGSPEGESPTEARNPTESARGGSANPRMFCDAICVPSEDIVPTGAFDSGFAWSSEGNGGG